jgi:hypothetical protein
MADWALDDRAQLHKDANELLDENLAPDEAVQVIIRGNFNSAMIATNRRVFVFKKGIQSGLAFSKPESTDGSPTAVPDAMIRGPGSS